MNKRWIALALALVAIISTITVIQIQKKNAGNSPNPSELSQDNHGTTTTPAGNAQEDASKDGQNQASAPNAADSAAGAAGSAGTTDAKDSGSAQHGSHSATGTGTATATVPGAATGTATATASRAQPPAPEKNCFAFQYRHKKSIKDRDIEDFLDYSNAFPVLHSGLNANSVCVKVNGKPVAFKMNKFQGKEEVMVGAVVGPESVIRVSYCVGKANCRESCQIKTNRYMDDLMSDAGDEDDFKESWDSENADGEQKKKLKNKVKELRAVASANNDLSKHAVMRDWDALEKQESVCNKK
jgi:hypothetical protein